MVLFRQFFALCVSALCLILCQVSASVESSSSVDERLGFVGTLFSGAKQHENFNRLKDLFPAQTIAAGPEPFKFPPGAKIDDDTSFRELENFEFFRAIGAKL